MFSEQIELRGHIIDSLILPKVLDEILARGASFKIQEIRIGRERTDPSYARIEISAATPEAVDDLVKRLRVHGAELVREEEARLEPAPADGVFPPNFYVTSNLPTFIHYRGQWLEVQPPLMDSAIAVDAETLAARAVKFYEVRQGMLIATGHRGVRVIPPARGTERLNEFEFMASGVSTERPKGAVIRALAAEMRQARETNGKILVVAGPAVVHTGAGEHFEKLIQWGYVQLLFSGNALAVHDIEQALYGTSLGVNLREGTLVHAGHENHMRAINTIRATGGISAAVRAGILTRGIMCQCVRHGVDLVLAGSIRDDGPLPEVITDVVDAQKAMRARVAGVRLALMLGTMLHSIAVGNLLPASVKTACIDINPGVVTKLADRGTFQALGLVTDLEPFLLELTAVLAQDRGPAAPAAFP